MTKFNGFLDAYVPYVGFRQHAGSWSGQAVQDIVLHASGQISHQYFGGSGRLEWRFGPHEGLAIRTSNPVGGSPYNDGFWPVPHSGQVIQMIEEASLQTINGEDGPDISLVGVNGIDIPNPVPDPGSNIVVVDGAGLSGLTFDLQGAYENGSRIWIQGGGFGPLEIVTTNRKFNLTSHGAVPEIHFSGVLEYPGITHERGDMVFLRHSATQDQGGNNVNDDLEAQALSLGFGQFVYNTGSGITNLVPGSGIGKSVIGTAQTFTSATTVNLTEDGIPDLNYGIDTSNDQVNVFIAGLYLCIYSVSVDVSSGTNRSVSRSRLLLNGTEPTEQVTRAYGYNRNTTDGKATLQNTCLINLEAGDTLEIEVTRESGASTLTTIAGEGNITLWRLGGKRTGTI